MWICQLSRYTYNLWKWDTWSERDPKSAWCCIVWLKCVYRTGVGRVHTTWADLAARFGLAITINKQESACSKTVFNWGMLQARWSSATVHWYPPVLFYAPIHCTVLFQLQHCSIETGSASPTPNPLHWITWLSRTKIHPQIQERVCKTTQSSLVATLAQAGQTVLWSIQFFMRKDNKLAFLLTLRKILVLPTCQLSPLPSTASEMLMQLCRVSFFSWCAKASWC